MTCWQPPSGGCVLKQPLWGLRLSSRLQPPSGGCVLKPTSSNWDGVNTRQPPSGGCVLKPNDQTGFNRLSLAAAFGRLCVETSAWARSRMGSTQPPSGGCVLKPTTPHPPEHDRAQPPSGGCVLKLSMVAATFKAAIAAAFGRLCVETGPATSLNCTVPCSRLRAAVC